MNTSTWEVLHYQWLVPSVPSTTMIQSIREAVRLLNFVLPHENYLSSFQIRSFLFYPSHVNPIIRTCRHWKDVLPFSPSIMPLNWINAFDLCRAEPLVSIVFLSFSMTFTKLLFFFSKASWTPSAMGLIWSTFRTSLWVDDSLLIGQDPIVFLQMFITWRFRMTLYKGSS